ncbi:glycosyltransferase family 4 protein [Shewanella xiamenensis]|uniref:glycosyltransferase family 4 protein n=1 Tax=Shewanella xiamenensis TaxID=332186 RepID=UPI002177B138|nr:glycosyltransferase family 4 protein [Shewanella xiamenensis]BDQ65470.1 glycosyltransferase WbuB [Shewanella xiamenensis]GLD79854.1 glycosyltransferase WbuB [Shewanella xiamenensis]
MTNVLHVLYQSYPNISGSSTRSKSIIDAMYHSQFFEPFVITSPLQEGFTSSAKEYIDGVLYYRTFKGGNDEFAVNRPKTFLTKLKKTLAFVFFTYDIYQVARRENVDVIHAHAMAFCGLPAWLVARVLGKKFVYEIRSDWHLDKSFSSGPFFQNVFGKLERFVAKKCDSLVVISSGLYNKYSKFNRNCYIVSNGVHDGLFSHSPISLTPFKTVEFGFIGSVIPLEGLEMVVKAIAKVKELHNVKLVLKIAGMGESIESVKCKAKELNVEEQIIFFGTLPFEKVVNFYNEVDVIVNFRRDEEIAHSVTPLKPLEAMAQKKLVIVSDVKGMLELVTDNANGIVVPAEDIDALANVLFNVYQRPDLYISIVDKASDYVRANYAWDKKITDYIEIYS